jgi:hypothetical protein
MSFGVSTGIRTSQLGRLVEGWDAEKQIDEETTGLGVDSWRRQFLQRHRE